MSMWKSIKSLLGRDHIDGEELQKDKDLRTAIAALLITVASSDETFGPQEKQQLHDIFTDHFAMKSADAKDLVHHASKESEDAVDMHRFVRAINDDLDNEQRKDILGYAWQMVLADGEIHDREDHIIRRLGPLLGISRKESLEIRDEVIEGRSRF